jgi:acetyltransferase-like isoleucine patch superfamily enzyme/acyl carrier protein
MNTSEQALGTTTRSLLRRAQREASERLARLALHGVTHLGARPHVSGFPFVENLGTLTIGDDLQLASGPVRSHLVTGIHGSLRIGHHVTIGQGAAIAAEQLVEIGDGAHLAAMVMLFDTDYHVAGDADAPPPTAPIVLGPDVWLGEGVTVLRGSTIGRGARVEAGSVVSGVVPEGARVAGVPARLVRAPDEVAPRIAAQSREAALERDVLRLAQEVFVLPALPALNDGPATLGAWDSLGSLRLLVSLEEVFAIHLPAGALAGVRDLAGVCALVKRSLPPA